MDGLQDMMESVGEALAGAQEAADTLRELLEELRKLREHFNAHNNVTPPPREPEPADDDAMSYEEWLEASRPFASKLGWGARFDLWVRSGGDRGASRAIVVEEFCRRDDRIRSMTQKEVNEMFRQAARYCHTSALHPHCSQHRAKRLRAIVSAIDELFEGTLDDCEIEGLV